MNPYDVLNISSNASPIELKKQYNKLVKQYHPDRHDGDDKKFKEILEAYQTITKNKQNDNVNKNQSFGAYFEKFLSEHKSLYDDFKFLTSKSLLVDLLTRYNVYEITHENINYILYANDTDNFKVINNINLETKILITISQYFYGGSIDIELPDNSIKTIQFNSPYLSINNYILAKELGLLFNKKRGDLIIYYYIDGIENMDNPLYNEKVKNIITELF